MGNALTRRKINSALAQGGIWLLLVKRKDMKKILQMMEAERAEIQAIQCETIAEITKLSLLLEAFDTWTIEGIREFMKANKNFPRIDES